MVDTAKPIEWRETDEGLKPWHPDHAVAWAPQPGSQQAFLDCPIFEVLYEGNRGGGKGLPLDAPVLTPRGWAPIGGLHEGSEVLTPSGDVARIAGYFPQGVRPTFRIALRDGRSVVADDQHRWQVKTTNGWAVRTTWDVYRQYQDGVSPWYFPTIDCAPYDVGGRRPVDPYVLGLLLGDGCFSGRAVRFYTVDEELAAAVVAGGMHETAPDSRTCVRTFCLRRSTGLYRGIEELGLMGKTAAYKSVPPAYLDGPPDVRLAVLQGLMDSDGSPNRSKGEFSSASRRLRDDAVYLARSLGAVASSRKKTTYRLPAYRSWIQVGNKFPLFRLPRKASAVTPYMHDVLSQRIESVERVGEEETACIAVDHPSSMFVAKDFVPTHNTDALLMDFAQHVGRGWGIEWKGILFRHTYKDLEDVVTKSKKWFPKIWPAATYNESKMFWGWPHGEKLIFSYLEKPSDYEHYHGHEYPWIAFEELTKWSDDKAYKVLLSCCRSPRRGLPRKFRATTNPYGVGHNWVKHRFQLPVTRGRMVGPVLKGDEDPKTGRRLERCVIHSDLAENRIFTSAQPDYRAQIAGAARNDSERKAWLFGSWDVVAGGMFDDIWDPAIHVVPNFPFRAIPRTWRVNRAYDHGQSAPFSVGWWAESNGEPLAWEGENYGQVPGDLFRIAEWYGWNGTPNEGLRMDAKDIAQGILDRENDWGMAARVKKGPADTSIFDDYSPGKSVAGDMKKKGVRWTPADKGPGSRKQGWEQLRTRLRGSLIAGRQKREEPGLFVCERCTQFLRTFPVLPRDEKKDLDDVDTESEDHIGDECRYRLREKRAGVTVQRI